MTTTNYAASLLKSFPRKPLANVQARLRLIAEPSKGKQQFWRHACSQGPDGLLLWLTSACWTFDPRARVKHRPFIPWPVQATAARQLWAAIAEGHDILIEKSRDMGATWLILATLVWFWQFEADTPLTVLSRKEDLVDRKGDPDTLFWKLEYLVEHQPDWLRPARERQHMLLLNTDNQSVISGESTNQNVGRGGRRKAMFLDEFAAVDDGGAVLSATADNSPCRIFASTPQGSGSIDASGTMRGNAFAAQRFCGKTPVITLPWWEHPEKGSGRELVLDEPSGKQRWTSPWYRGECDRRASRVEVAQEIDIDYLASGSMFFDADVLARLRTSKDIKPPRHLGEVLFETDTVSEGQHYRLRDIHWTEGAGRSRLAVWCEILHGKPVQDRNYVAFADISAGTGASNSVLRVVDVNIRTEVAVLVDSHTPAQDFARQNVAICQWFGGQIGYCLLGWETNGEGQVYGQELHRLGYPYVLGNYNPEIAWHPRDERIGWCSTRTKKLILLGNFRASLARGEYITHDLSLIGELERYIYYENGGVGPSELTEEPEGAREAHGDRVIAAAGCELMMAEQPRGKPVSLPAPPGSLAYRSQQYRQRMRDTGDRWK